MLSSIFIACYSIRHQRRLPQRPLFHIQFKLGK
jgi:hypothetical protein